MTTRNIAMALASVLAFSAGVEADEYLRPGILICRAGYVMDSYRIDNGYLVERPMITALEGPNLYAITSLLDIDESLSSTWHILDPPPGPPQSSTIYGLGTEVTNNEVLIDLARSVGKCDTCGGGGETTHGFKAEVVGMVMNVSPLTIEIREARIPVMGHECETFYTPAPTTLVPTESPVTASPTLRPTPSPTNPPTIATPSPTAAPSKSPTTPPTKSPTMAPTIPSTSKAPTASPTSSPTMSTSAETIVPKDPTVNCSQYQETFVVPDLPESVIIRHVVNIDEKNSSKSTLSAQVIYEGQAWVGFGISPNGGMNGSSVVIGSVEESDFVPINPGKYYLGGHGQEFVSLVEEQTLLDESVVQNETHTVLSFTMYLEEPGQPSINGNGTNRFIVAIGYSNEFAYHEHRTSFLMELSPCIDEPFNPFVNVTGNYTDGNWTDIGDIIFPDGEGVPDAIPFDGADSGFGPPGVGIAQGRSAGNFDEPNQIADELSSAATSRYTALVLGLTGLMAMFL